MDNQLNAKNHIEFISVLSNKIRQYTSQITLLADAVLIYKLGQNGGIIYPEKPDSDIGKTSISIAYKLRDDVDDLIKELENYYG